MQNGLNAARNRVSWWLACALAVGCPALQSCSSLMFQDTRIEGRVLLEGGGALDGSRVVLNGDKTTVTDTRGDYFFEGVINGSDEFEVSIARDGYGGMRITGTLEHDPSSTEDVKIVRVSTVTLPKL